MPIMKCSSKNKRSPLIMMQNILPKTFLATALFGALSFSINSQAQSDEADKPRWFEVEIIVFKPKQVSNADAEAWDKDNQLSKPENLIDFLQPFESPELSDEDLNTDPLEAASLSAEEKATAAKQDLASSEQVSLSGSLDEEPFVLLEESLLQLNNEANSLKRHPEYQLVLHHAWRQPVLNSREAPYIRIAGGLDFSEEYNYDGSQKLAPLVTEPLETESKLLDETLLETTKDNQLTLAEEEPETQDTAQAIPLPWVPEIDGDIHVYLNRYLHVRTNLILRQVGQQEVEILDIPLSNDPLMSSGINLEAANTPTGLLAYSSATGGSENNPITEVSAANNLLQKPLSTNEPLNNLGESKNQFSWEIDDNFLESETKKVYLERLFNYPLTQSRRLKSGELHYFDHPRIGLILLITPYDSEESSTDDDNLSPLVN